MQHALEAGEYLGGQFGGVRERSFLYRPGIVLGGWRGRAHFSEEVADLVEQVPTGCLVLHVLVAELCLRTL